jgi:hypothetical protein
MGPSGEQPRNSRRRHSLWGTLFTLKHTLQERPVFTKPAGTSTCTIGMVCGGPSRARGPHDRRSLKQPRRSCRALPRRGRRPAAARDRHSPRHLISSAGRGVSPALWPAEPVRSPGLSSRLVRLRTHQRQPRRLPASGWQDRGHSPTRHRQEGHPRLTPAASWYHACPVP